MKTTLAITLSFIVSSFASSLYCSEQESLPLFDTESLCACLNFNKIDCSSACQLPECENGLRLSIAKLGIVFNDEFLSKIKNSDVDFCVSSCNGDDAITYRSDFHNHNIEVTESRAITVFYQLNEQDEQSSEDTTRQLINKILLSILKKPINQEFHIRIDPNTRYKGTACGLIDDHFQACILWRLQSNQLMFFVGNSACDEEKAFYDFSDPEPIIKFPSLRKIKGIQSEPRQDILERKLLMEKRQTYPLPMLGPLGTLAADSCGPTPTPKLLNSGQSNKEAKN